MKDKIVLTQDIAYTVASKMCVTSAPKGTMKWVPESWPFQDIALDEDSGCIHGKVSGVQLQHIRVHDLDPNGKGPFSDVTIVVVDKSGKPGVGTTALASHPTGETFSEDLDPIPGKDPYLWKITSGALPAGLTLDPAGRIFGKATTAGTTTIKLQVTDADGNSSQETAVAIPITAAPDCTNAKYDAGKYFNGWVPLSAHRYTAGEVDSPATDNDVTCFWGASGVLAPLTQVQYIYGFGEGTNTLSADMLSIQFSAPVGMQVSLGTSVTGGGSTNSAPGQVSASAAIASLEAGGNFYLRAMYPIYVYNSSSITFLTALNAKFGFGVNGFAGQATLSQGTEQYVSVPGEVYFAYNGIGNAGGFYADYRGGLQSVPGGDFKKALGLSSNTFALHQLSFGLNFGGLMRIGAQRYYGPAAGFNVPSGANFNKWHLVIQLSPGAAKKSGS
jgi:hypothetical protein